MTAVTELVNRWQPALIAYARIVTRDTDLAAEAVQESWISSTRAITKLQDPARFRSWLYRIVHNQCIDLIRLKQRHRQTMATHTLENEVLQDNDSLNSIDNADEVNHVLGRIPENQRAILSLYYLSELDIKEIAGLLALPTGTVKSRLHTARETFRRFSEKTSILTHEGINND